MILTSLQHIERYGAISGNLAAAASWLKENDFQTLPEGRYSIDGDKVFALVQQYQTKSPELCFPEAHRVYIDIQLLVSGREIVEVCGAEGLAIKEPYKPDIEFFQPAADAQKILLKPGFALILFPEDVHRPCMSESSSPEPVKKIVIKVAL